MFMKRLGKSLLLMVLSLALIGAFNTTAAKTKKSDLWYGSDLGKVTIKLTKKKLIINGTLYKAKVVDQGDNYFFMDMPEKSQKLKGKKFTFKMDKKVKYIYTGGEMPYVLNQKQFMSYYKNIKKNLHPDWTQFFFKIRKGKAVSLNYSATA